MWSSIVVRSHFPEHKLKSVSRIHPPARDNIDRLDSHIGLKDEPSFAISSPLGVINLVVLDDQEDENEKKRSDEFHGEDFPEDTLLATGGAVAFLAVVLCDELSWTHNWCRWCILFIFIFLHVSIVIGIALLCIFHNNSCKSKRRSKERTTKLHQTHDNIVAQLITELIFG